MFYAITSLLVKFRKSLRMAFEDDTSIEDMGPFFEILLQLELLAKFIWIWFACGFDRMLLETTLCQVWNKTDGSKWSQTPTLDFFH